MGKRLFAIAFIYAVTTAAWVALAATIFARTHSTGERLAQRVGSTWGVAHAQEVPALLAAAEPVSARTQRDAADGGGEAADQARPVARGTAKPPTSTAEQRIFPTQTRATVDLRLDYRRKGLLWYSTYAVAFAATFRFTNPGATEATAIRFQLPAEHAIYDDLRVVLNGAPAAYAMEGQSLVVPAAIASGGDAVLAVTYRSQGLDAWRYVLGGQVAQVRDFDLIMRTNFTAVDFPDNTLSPTAKRRLADGWELRWRYGNLLTGFDIAMDMPRRLQPGPLAGQIALFAPVSLLFFFAVMFILASLRKLDIHPMNYAFLAAAFFAFHLLLAYLVDHISIHVAFLISAVVSVGLVVSYLRLVAGPRFALREAGVAQFVYLVLFSYAFFFEGFTGLTITIGAIVTLFVAMQVTGRVRWSEIFAAPARDARGGARV